jgi:hypothetical protein
MDDVKSWYALSDIECFHYTATIPVHNLNAGMLSVHTEDIDLRLFTRLLTALSHVKKSRITDDFVIEQTAYAVLFGRLKLHRKIQRLPNVYFMFPKKFTTGMIAHPVCIHFTGYYETERRLYTIALLARAIIFHP